MLNDLHKLKTFYVIRGSNTEYARPREAGRAENDSVESQIPSTKSLVGTRSLKRNFITNDLTGLDFIRVGLYGRP